MKDLRHFLLSLSISKGLSANGLTTAPLLGHVVASVHLRVRKQRFTLARGHTLRKDAPRIVSRPVYLRWEKRVKVQSQHLFGEEDDKG